MKSKLIAVLFFFVSFSVSFGVYAYYNKQDSVVAPLFVCLAFGGLVAIGSEYYKSLVK